MSDDQRWLPIVKPEGNVPESPRFGDHAAHQRRGLVRPFSGAALGAHVAHECARPLTQLDEPVGFELTVGLDDGGGIHPKARRQLTHRRQCIARPERARCNGDTDTRSDLGIQGRWAAGVDLVEHEADCIIVPIQYYRGRTGASV